MERIKINLYDLLLCLSNAQDMVSPELSNHHRQVAYLSFRLAQRIGFTAPEQKEVYLAALVHDIGALSSNERLQIIDSESGNVNDHSLKGEKLISGFAPLRTAARIIRFHHRPWNGGGDAAVPLASHIVHLADRVCVRLDPKRNVLTQLPEILPGIEQQRGTLFEPTLVDALLELSTKEYIWLDLVNRSALEMLPYISSFGILDLEIDDIIDLAEIFSHIIDFKSSFTARHSAGVAKTAEKLAELAGFSPIECKMMLIAGYLHDLGKLAIDNSVLEKPAKLNADEFNEMRAHTYYTYHLLEPIPQLRTINVWASYHHERLNGTGYPFGISGDNLPLGARVMAVADVFTAITEHRPYRAGMDDGQAKQVLNNMVISGSLDGQLVRQLIEHFSVVNDIREQAQLKASEQYRDFLSATESQ